ncbi:MAG: Bpu10I family restriction endonuclease [Candidatus Competibacteraceae bacterium]
MKEFSRQLSPRMLNIEDKIRSNLFAWRGQFSPQLIQYLLDAYCLPGSVVLDPFAGSGTVLYEAAAMSLAAYGFEINPAAWCFSKVYEFANMTLEERKRIISELRHRINDEFQMILFADDHLSADLVETKVIHIADSINDQAKILCNALIVFLDIYNNSITNGLVHGKFNALAELILRLPFSDKPIKADLQDARALPLKDESIDFAITSPPYINVFNYHQNYRRSVELLGWDLLRVARSEIGSNRANRGNRFFTVIQYSIDIAKFLQELSRVLTSKGRALLIVGYESRVLGTPFYNANIIDRIARASGFFEVVLRQQRVFVNRFGKAIREEILNLAKVRSHLYDEAIASTLGRSVAHDALNNAVSQVPKENSAFLAEALERINEVQGTPLFDSSSYRYYQTRDCVMMVKEEINEPLQKLYSKLPTPHLDKLEALLRNPRLPPADKPRVKEAVERYREWIRELGNIKSGQENTVQKLVEVTNQYKTFIELHLIFDSPENFLYRQKGQLKLDNTILEEFLPQLVYRSLRLGDQIFEFGPRSTFTGLSFTSSITIPGNGGYPKLRTKDQDFILGKRLFIMTSFDKEFHKSEIVESHLGYVCAECKTNLDKTMFQEAVATSRDLKIAVPSSLYFLVCEFLDMTPVSITSTQIDDVLIVRKAKRMSSNIRQEYTSSEARRKHRQAYVDFLESAKYYADVFQRMIDKIQTMVDETDPGVDKVLKQGHF